MLAPIALLVLTACENTQTTLRSYYNIMQQVIEYNADHEVAYEDALSSPYKLASIKSGERGIAIIALAFVENGIDKWISNDNALLYLDSGRVVKTLGFNNDLQFTSSLELDPLKSLEPGVTSKWNRIVDWESGEYGYLVSSTFEDAGSDILHFYGHSLNTDLWIETATYSNKSRYMRFDQEWQNKYWFDKDTGVLLRTEQKSAPFSDLMEITFVSEVVAVLEAKSNG